MIIMKDTAKTISLMFLQFIAHRTHKCIIILNIYNVVGKTILLICYTNI